MREMVGLNVKKSVVNRDNSDSRMRRTNHSRSVNPSVDQILFLQRTVGNQAVQRLLRSGALQAKLRIGQPGDVYEQEADRVADAVMRMPEMGVQRQVEPEEEEEEETLQTKPLVNQITPLAQVQRQEEPEEEEMLQVKPLAEEITPLVQRQVDPEEEEEELQAKATSGRLSEINSNLESQIQSFKGGGKPLSENDRAFFEPRFVRDFSHVRVHTESSAADTAKSINARAFTLGNHVVMGSGEYHPNSRSGQRLLGHELTHVIQQGEGRTSNKAQHRESIESDPIDAVPGKVEASEFEPGPVKGKFPLAHEHSHVIQQGTAQSPAKEVVQRKMNLPKTTRSSSFIPLGIRGEGNRKRLSIIIRSNDTLNTIAEKLLPMWNNAPPIKSQPSLPPTQITKEQLAKALLINNQYYLAIPPNLSVPQMTNWKVGLRFPLPVWVNRITGDPIVNPYQIATQAKHFNPKWTTLLAQKPKPLPKLSPQEKEKLVAAVISSEESNYYRGFSLAYKSLKNAAEYLPIVEATLGKVGAGKFELALGFMSALVNFQFDLLTNQIPGLGILELIKKALASPPAKLSPDRKTSLKRAKKKLARLGVYSAKVAEVFRKTYVSQRWARPGNKCMHAFYRGLGALYGKPFSKALGKQVRKEARAYERRTRIDTNSVTRIMETLKSKGKAGPKVVMRYQRRAKTWAPDPETTILGMTHATVAGWYFFGFSIHGAYHSVILAVDKTDIASPKIYWMDQHEKGFTKNVTGRLVAEMKSWKPSYGFANTKLWQMIPDADTLVRLD